MVPNGERNLNDKNNKITINPNILDDSSSSQNYDFPKSDMAPS